MILDDIRADLPNAGQTKGQIEAFDTMIKSAVIVKAHNVSQYYYDNDKDYWAPEDFPNVAPPWQNVWIEWNIPGFWNTDRLTHIPEICKYEQVREGLWRVYAPDGGDYAATHLVYEEADWTKEMGIRWIIHASYYRGKLPGKYLITQTFFVTPEGQIKPIESDNELAIRLMKKNLNIDWEEPDSEHHKYIVPSLLSPNAYLARQAGMFQPDTSAYDVAFLTISFCNCKNVVAVKEMIDEKLRKKRVASGKLNITKTYTLNIQPIKTILRSEGGSHNVGLQKALHICRGRFRDYTEGHGLFGKHHGLYYWHDMVRGTATKGEVKKDYNVSPEK